MNLKLVIVINFKMSQAVRFLDTHVMKAVMKALILYDGVWAKEGPQVVNVSMNIDFNAIVFMNVDVQWLLYRFK